MIDYLLSGSSYTKTKCYTSNHLLPLTSNFVHILERQSQRLVCWSFWWKDGIQGFKQGLPAGITILSLDAPALEPLHVCALFKHVVSMPTRDGYECHCFWVVANLLDVGAHLFHYLIVTRLGR